MGLISRVSSRTYRFRYPSKSKTLKKSKNGPTSFIQPTHHQKTKPKVHPTPLPTIRPCPLRMAKTQRYRLCPQATILRYDDHALHRFRYQRQNPTLLPGPNGFQKVLGSQRRGIELLDDV